MGRRVRSRSRVSKCRRESLPTEGEGQRLPRSTEWVNRELSVGVMVTPRDLRSSSMRTHDIKMFTVVSTVVGTEGVILLVLTIKLRYFDIVESGRERVCFICCRRTVSFSMTVRVGRSSLPPVSHPSSTFLLGLRSTLNSPLT